MNPEIYATGPQVTLRGWTPRDLAVFREWMRPGHDWHRWDGPYYPVPSDAEADAAVEALARAAGVVSAPAPGPAPGSDGLPPRRLVIDVGGELVGTVAWYWESRETAWVRTGITVYDPEVRGRGIGREALGLWVSYLFAATDWVRLDFATWSGNHAMLAVGRALGFTEEGRFRQAREVDGRRYDSVVMGVLREEWPG
ncbi:GNAT family N-acetyltransferase [Antribacter gilvus]|uniref:GNAT family N-acetyltransferase n=1 Tax=Antribacter gilvus TaxID=2304675 RepID=UPI001F0C617E|nr:GNAT family protein [Antribacter gilvus]